MIATNLVLSSADALITNGSVITGNEGDFVLESSNSARIVAVVTSSVSGDTAIGIVLAFNTIGWNAQNFLFNTVDALFGTSIGSENTSRVLAAADGTSIETAGGISVLAESTADIRAHIENAATAIGVGLGGSDSITVAPVIAMNKVSTDVRATVVNGAGGQRRQCGGRHRCLLDQRQSKRHGALRGCRGEEFEGNLGWLQRGAQRDSQRCGGFHPEFRQCGRSG